MVIMPQIFKMQSHFFPLSSTFILFQLDAHYRDYLMWEAQRKIRYGLCIGCDEGLQQTRLRCLTCRMFEYCSAECLVRDRPTHDLYCVDASRARRMQEETIQRYLSSVSEDSSRSASNALEYDRANNETGETMVDKTTESANSVVEKAVKPAKVSPSKFNGNGSIPEIPLNSGHKRSGCTPVRPLLFGSTGSGDFPAIPLFSGFKGIGGIPAMPLLSGFKRTRSLPVTPVSLRFKEKRDNPEEPLYLKSSTREDNSAMSLPSKSADNGDSLATPVTLGTMEAEMTSENQELGKKSNNQDLFSLHPVGYRRVRGKDLEAVKRQLQF